MAISLSSRAQRALGGIAPMQTGDTGGDTDLNWDDPYADSGLVSTTSGGSRIPQSYYDALGKARTDTAALAREKYETEQAAATAAAERLRQGQAAQAAYLRSQLGAGIPSSITGEIETQERAGQQFIQDQYQNLLSALGQRRGVGEQQLRTGYDALQTFLSQNPAVAYAQTQRAMPTVAQSDLANYMATRGISAEPSQQALEALNAQLAGGASNYNQLLNVLTGAEQQQQASRLAEEQMARQLGMTQLGQLYAGATAGLEQERLAALNELAARVSAARLQAQQQQAARDQALQDALATLLGQGYVPPTESEGAVAPTAPTGTEPISLPIGPPPTRAQRVETAGQQFSSFKEAVKALNPRQVAEMTKDGSGLSAKEIAELKRRNPKLAAQF